MPFFCNLHPQSIGSVTGTQLSWSTAKSKMSSGSDEDDDDDEDDDADEDEEEEQRGESDEEGEDDDDEEEGGEADDDDVASVNPVPPSAAERTLPGQKKRKKRGPGGASKRTKIDISKLSAQGPGPWKVFMMVNVGSDEETKKQTEIRLDTYPDLVKAVKNATDQGDWVTILRLGDFYDLDFAGTVLSEWSDGTRGPGPRITQGIMLWEKYKNQGIKLGVCKQTKREVQDIILERKRLRQLEEDAAAAVANSNASETTLPEERQGSLTVREVMKTPGKQKGGGKGQGPRKKVTRKRRRPISDRTDEELAQVDMKKR